MRKIVLALVLYLKPSPTCLSWKKWFLIKLLLHYVIVEIATLKTT